MIFWGDGEMGGWGGGEMVREGFEKGTFDKRIWYNKYIAILEVLITDN
ncbi:MAG: hypothetical protein F6K24_00560 [Okeania sp. SIO2D1]|nr:hypothetical protein [Okeania sp. SIO2D1]